jgi:hypothetical protein
MDGLMDAKQHDGGGWNRLTVWSMTTNTRGGGQVMEVRLSLTLRPPSFVQREIFQSHTMETSLRGAQNQFGGGSEQEVAKNCNITAAFHTTVHHFAESTNNL